MEILSSTVLLSVALILNWLPLLWGWRTCIYVPCTQSHRYIHVPCWVIYIWYGLSRWYDEAHPFAAKQTDRGCTFHVQAIHIYINTCIVTKLSHSLVKVMGTMTMTQYFIGICLWHCHCVSLIDLADGYTFVKFNHVAT